MDIGKNIKRASSRKTRGKRDFKKKRDTHTSWHLKKKKNVAGKFQKLNSIRCKFKICANLFNFFFFQMCERACVFGKNFFFVLSSNMSSKQLRGIKKKIKRTGHAGRMSVCVLLGPVFLFFFKSLEYIKDN